MLSVRGLCPPGFGAHSPSTSSPQGLPVLLRAFPTRVVHESVLIVVISIRSLAAHEAE